MYEDEMTWGYANPHEGLARFPAQYYSGRVAGQQIQTLVFQHQWSRIDKNHLLLNRICEDPSLGMPDSQFVYFVPVYSLRADTPNRPMRLLRQ